MDCEKKAQELRGTIVKKKNLCARGVKDGSGQKGDA